VRIPDLRQHLIETKADLLRLTGVQVDDLAEEVYIDKQRATRWIREKLGPNFGRNRPIAAVSLGATVEYKRWSADNLNIFLNMFPVNSCDFVFLGAPNEREFYEGVYSYNNTVVDLVGQTTIEELTWVLDRADIYIGPDSGPMHLAVGRNTPVVALFGPTDPARCGPYRYQQSVVIRSDHLCRDCETRFGKHISQCLHTIDPEAVYLGCVGLLAQYCDKWTLDLA
jgi:ADP-heptose:LPS heptosyltransferase